MQETTQVAFHLDEFATPAHADETVLWRGWAIGRSGIVLCDLRVRIGERLFPSVFGFPRPDLAQHFQESAPFLLAGFEVALRAPAGASRAIVEACSVGDGWVVLKEISLSVPAGTDAQSAEPSQRRELHPHELVRLLRIILQRSRETPPDRIAHDLVAALPHPNVVRYPPLPFHGHLHQPASLERSVFGRLIVEGWLFHESATIRRVAATVDLQAWSSLEYGAELPYVSNLFPQFPAARRSRLHGFVDVPSSLPQPLTLRVYAELTDGTWHLCHVQRNHVIEGELDKLPYGPLRLARFITSALALRRAAAAQGIHVPLDRGSWRALREMWREYRTRADLPGAPAPEARAPGADAPSLPRRVVLVTHNLNFEGAPLFLLEFAAHLVTRGVSLHVVSAAEGPLRARLAALGANVQIVDVRPLHQAASLREWRTSLANLSATVDLQTSDLVVANTLSAHWGIHLAHGAGRRSLFYIHESTTPDVFYHGHLSPELLPEIKNTFGLATHVSFLTDSTRRYYRPVLTRANHSINPGWIDLAKLSRFREEHTRDTLRTKLRLSASTRLIVNIGTVCDRKGQHIFARAVDLLWRRRPELAAACEFLIVGGRQTTFDEHTSDILAQLRRTNLRIVGETATPYDYYGAADLFVCSSYEESFPRVVLEAMGFGLPIVSTDVHGIPEMARHDQEALLVPPGNPAALALAMETLLSDPARAARFAASAQTRVAEEFDAAQLLRHHAALAARVATLT